MKQFIFIAFFFLQICATLHAQEDTTAVAETPVITYNTNNHKKYVIADIQVTGVESYGYQNNMLVGISGLSVGDKVEVPGDELTDALRAFLKHGLFSWGQILATKQTADSVWIEIKLRPNPIISELNFTGVKKSEKEDLEAKIGMAKGTQITPNLINRATKKVKEYFDEKGFSNATVNISQRTDLSQEGKVILDIAIDKNQKTKINRIYLTGNKEVSSYDLKIAMKKTNERASWKDHFKLSIREMFSTKKFVEEEYKADKDNLILKYNEKGYRDAYIVSDSVVPLNDKYVDVYIHVDEGDKYHIRNISWIGNTKYSTEELEYLLNMKAGEVYNQKKLNQRLMEDEDAVANLYYNSGYMWADVSPIEVYVDNDSVDLEIRVREGIQASINRVIINGNDRLYEDIVRRELITKPGQLFSRDDLMRTARELAQMGHFDPETIAQGIETTPDPETGTIDLTFNLTPKANDQIEFSAGWGETGIIGRMSLKFSNFSVKNLFHPKSYKGLLPQGEGQTLTLSGQTNGQYYQSYSISFLDPWFGGKRPNSFSLSAYYMSQTGIDSRSYTNNYYNSYYNYGYGSYDYGSSYYAYDSNQYMRIFGLSAGYGKRLRWPDDYFQLMADLSYQHYWLKNWGSYFPISDGDANSLTFGLTLSRNSIDNPIYTRRGSTFSLSVNATPPYSLFDGIDYSKLDQTDPQMYRWIEYHKWKFKGKIFIPLQQFEKGKMRTPVLMNRIEYGFVGAYNSHKYNPFETFYMGGDGMTGYSTMYANETIGLRGYENGSLTPNYDGYAYSRLALELRYPFLLEQTSTIYGLVFVEAGNAWSTIRSFNPFDLKRSAGVGVRIFLPMIGLMGIDWAYGFDRPNSSSTAVSGSQFHFIIGQEF
ncbi:MAG: outer membrane protein assembly factor BamA [Candidatus Symbiothrix sp.]|jgi:outer membrane protein insertion porin family|nr:outer membrane protein assembly factor BamA [Candidatus Symbiothrix sp.]